MNEKQYLRELAKQYREIAHLPVMRQKTDLWYKHNSLQSERPMVVMEIDTFADDILPPPRCETLFAKRMERELVYHIQNFMLVGDDKVVPPYFTVPMDIDLSLFSIERKREFATDTQGRQIGWKEEPVIRDIERDLPALKNSSFSWDSAATQAYIDFCTDILGTLLPVKVKNKALEWTFGISQRVIELMGMEALMYEMVDNPEAVYNLYQFICDDFIAIVRKMESGRLLTPNNGNDYVGSGSYGFSKELAPIAPVTSQMLWGNMNSQETVGISNEMYGELVFPHYQRIAKEFGLVYYGCCEPVDPIWDGYLSKIKNIRKVSISPWCDQEFMGERLKNSSIIFSRKPSPNYIGVGANLDGDAYARHIGQTLQAAKGCTLEIIHRDIYTLTGNVQKVKQAVDIIYQQIERMW